MAAITRRRPLAHAVQQRIAGLEALDGPARRASSAVRAAIPRGAVDGVRQTAFDRALEDWTPALAPSAPAEGRPTLATAAGVELVVVLRDGAVHALADRCSDCGAALHEGEVSELIACPLNGTRFRLADGSLEDGPSAYPQPAFETRLRDGRVEVRSARPGGRRSA